jgi:hypothetical protein
MRAVLIDLAAQCNAPSFEVVLVLQGHETDAVDEMHRISGPGTTLVVRPLD